MYRIFCVEDDETIGKMIKKHLEKWNFEVHVAEDLSQIMTEFAAFDPQLVLMDIRLPFYNGYYWCTEIRKVSKVPVIFLSSSGDDMNLVMAINLGADDFAGRPHSQRSLRRRVLRAIHGKAPRERAFRPGQILTLGEDKIYEETDDAR